MHDPGNVYLLGYAALFALVAVTLYFAKLALNKRGEATRLTMKPIIALATASVLFIMAGVAKVTVFADYYNANSIYMPV